jgi:transcriptional regulator with XRE-family HTH domain
MEKNIGFKIRKVRELKNLSQNYVADKLSLSQSTYSETENGKTQVTDQKLNQIATILEVSPEVIKGFSDAVVFNSCNQSGQYNTYKITNPIEKIEELYAQIFKQHEDQIKALETIIQSKDELISLLKSK